MADCLFCGIATKRVSAPLVAESEKTVAFRDIHPKAPVHILVIPKEHFSSLMDFQDQHASIINEIHSMIRRVAVQEKIDKQGFRIVVNTGKDAGQVVHHVHYHILAGRQFQE